MSSPAMAHAALAFAAVCGWVTLAALAFAPSGAWPQTGHRGNVERTLLFFVVAAVTRMTITDHQTRIQILVLATVAIAFEFARASVAKRSNGVLGWVSSTVGVVAGGATMHFVMDDYLWHWGW